MHLENIHEGDVFKNYKELCAALGTEPKTGCSKMAHINQLGTFCQFHKSGREFCIDKIYDKALAPTANTPQETHLSSHSFNAYIQPLLLQLIYTHGGQLSIGKTDLYRQLGMISPITMMKEIEKDFLKNPLVESLLLSELKRRLYTKLRSTLSYTMQTLESKNVITHKQVTVLTDMNGCKHIATPNEEHLVDYYSNCVLKELNCKNIDQVFFSGKTYIYYQRLYTMIKGEGWKSVKNEILFELTNQYRVEPIEEKSLKNIQHRLNKNLQKFLIDQALSDYSDSRKFVLSTSITKKAFKDPKFSFGLLSKDDFKSVLSDFCQKFVYNQF